jgi:hypothetical protein
MRFVDYSHALLSTGFTRLSDGAPINVRHYNAIIAWLALANDALVSPETHLLRSPNEGSLGEVVYPSVRAPSPLGQELTAFVAGQARPTKDTPAWGVVIANALTGATRELRSNFRILSDRVGDSIVGRDNGVDVYSIAALVNDFELSSIDPTALDASTVIHVNPATATAVLSIRPVIEQALQALVSGDAAQLPLIVSQSSQLSWFAEERRVSALRSEGALGAVLVALLVIVLMLNRSAKKARRAAEGLAVSDGGRAGALRLPGPNQPIGRAGMGPTRLA